MAEMKTEEIAVMMTMMITIKTRSIRAITVTTMAGRKEKEIPTKAVTTQKAKAKKTK
jgi:hypothetical protein